MQTSYIVPALMLSKNLLESNMEIMNITNGMRKFSDKSGIELLIIVFEADAATDSFG